MGEEQDENSAATAETETTSGSASEAVGAGPLSEQEKTWGVAAHLCPLIGFAIPFGNIIAPLLLWQFKKENLPFASGEAKEVLNMQICVSIISIVLGILTFAFLGPVISIIIGVTTVVFMVKAALKAKEGVSYLYPYIFRLIK